jgi:isoleucyl-tRNA synthetase
MVTKSKFFPFREENKLEVSEFKRIEFKSLPYDQEMEIDLHRPFVDEIRFSCPSCQGRMKRTKEVIDCWFDSGSMPFAQAHWPFEQKEGIKKPPDLFPADYISEAVDQTRGWFYTLHAISTLLDFGPAYKNVISVGHILDEKGEKMSKSKGNVVNPWQMISAYGADAVRWYFFTLNQPGDSKLFSEKDLSESQKRFIMTFWNCAKFFETYKSGNPQKPDKIKNLLDKWIISKLEHLESEVKEKMEGYDVTSAARLIESFVIDDLSLWYIRRSRRRFQRPEEKGDLQEASFVLAKVLKETSLMLAPFVPFLSEEVYKMAGGKRSVHLEDWPAGSLSNKNKELNERMDVAREVVKLGLKARASSGLKIRQPLSEFRFCAKKADFEQGIKDIIKEELNVKEIKSAKAMPSGSCWKKEKSGDISVALNVKMTPELEEEGEVKEMLRFIQEMRKQAKLKPKDRIEIHYSGEKKIEDVVEKNQKYMLSETRALGLKEGKNMKTGYNIEKEAKIGKSVIWFGIRKIKR